MNTASVLEAAADIFGVNYVITDSWIFQAHCCIFFFFYLSGHCELPLFWRWVQFFSLKLQRGFVSPQPASTERVLSLKTTQVLPLLVHIQLAPSWHLNQQHLHFAVQTSVFTIYRARSINQISHVRQRWPIKHLILLLFFF